MPNFIVNISKLCFLNQVKPKILTFQKLVWRLLQKVSFKSLTDTNLLTTTSTETPMIEKTSSPSNTIEKTIQKFTFMINLYKNILAQRKLSIINLFKLFIKFQFIVYEIFLDFTFKTLKYYNHLIVVDA